jgi:hypothetical protein
MDNCEIVGWLEKIDKKQSEMIEKLHSIEIQTTKTNGRVTALEAFKKNILAITGSAILASITITIFILNYTK